MRKLWISIIAILIILVAVIIFLPLGFSFYLAKNANTLVKNVYISPKVSLTLLNFNRGWYTSTAQLKVNVNLSPSLLLRNKMNGTYSFISNLKILNGPFVFYRNNAGKLNFAFAKGVLVNHIDNQDLQFRNVSVWNFNNKILTHYRTQKFNYDFKPANVQLQITNGSGDSIYNVNTGDLTVTTTIQDGNMGISHDEATPQTTIKFSGLQSSIKANMRVNPWYLFGVGDFSIGQLGIYSSSATSIQATNLSLRVKALKQNETVSNKVYLNVDNIMKGKADLGALALALDISGLNANAYVALHDQIARMQSNNGFDNPEETHRLNMLFLNLLSRGFNIDLEKFYFGTGRGAVNLSGTLDVPNLGGQMNPIALLFESKAKFDLQIPRAWLNNLLEEFYKAMFAELNKSQGDIEEGQMSNTQALTSNVINHWVSNKMLIVNGDNLTMKLELQSGRLLINGLAPQFSAQGFTPPAEPPMKPVPVPPVSPTPPAKPASPATQGNEQT